MKDIIYIDYYTDEKKQWNIGFLRVESGQMEIVLRRIPFGGEVKRNVYLVNSQHEEKRQIAQIVIKDGMGQVRMQALPEWNEKNILYIPFTENSYGTSENFVRVLTQNSTDASSMRKKVLKHNSDDMEEKYIFEEVIDGNKWKQIYKSYPNIHIFTDSDTILIKPKDMVVLQYDYHSLATNSFLLHAYYNYKQLILMRHVEDGKYYIAVPGIYREREKQIAKMYGFTRFENGESCLENGIQREVYEGCFGYYMVEVKI